MNRVPLAKIAAIAGALIIRWLKRPNKVKVFDPDVITDSGRKDRSKSIFSYLNRSAKREAVSQWRRSAHFKIASRAGHRA
jgi:hypothetical protein